jgi:hypothetical protein
MVSQPSFFPFPSIITTVGINIPSEKTSPTRIQILHSKEEVRILQNFCFNHVILKIRSTNIHSPPVMFKMSPTLNSIIIQTDRITSTFSTNNTHVLRVPTINVSDIISIDLHTSRDRCCRSIVLSPK